MAYAAARDAEQRREGGAHHRVGGEASLAVRSRTRRARLECRDGHPIRWTGLRFSRRAARAWVVMRDRSMRCWLGASLLEK